MAFSETNIMVKGIGTEDFYPTIMILIFFFPRKFHYFLLGEI